MIDRLIEDAIVLGGANPDRVYLMGYSAGGDGVYQLAPRLADRLAAAAMMAGHPNDASPLGLRNLPFTIHVGALDNGFDRNKVAQQWGEKLDALQKADPNGYVHEVKLHDGRGHWMQREDAVALDWMAQFTRQAYPTRVLWNQTRALHDQFYWLKNADTPIGRDAYVEADRAGQTIRIIKAEGIKHLRILLTDGMVDLDQPVQVKAGDQVLFNAIVPRTINTINQTLQGRLDPTSTYDAAVAIELPTPLADR
ncbi:MAG: dienelactone hydrolase family protein [Tepidisphaeraceae bacterium]